MYPLSAQTLSLQDIAHHWSRQLPGQPSAEEVLDTLWRHFWQGELAGLHVPATDHAPSASRELTRRRALEVLRGNGLTDRHPGVRFVADRAFVDLPPVEQPDGSLLVDTSTVIYLPAEKADWTDPVLDSAYARLATTELQAIEAGDAAGFRLQHLLRRDFAAYCDSQGYVLPPFWFSLKSRHQASAQANTRCRAWLQEQISRPKRGSKRDYRQEALKRIANLTQRTFDRIWGELAPEEWKQGGRRRDSQT